MNWEALGAIAEAAGVIAILISLIYVAARIRQNTKQFMRNAEANQLAAFERNIESGIRTRELLILNPELAQLLLKGFESYTKLEKLDKFRFELLLRNLFSAMQGAYVRQLAVAHDPLEFEGNARILDEILVHPGTREWLGRNSPDWRPAFREFVDERVAVVERRLGQNAH